MCGFVGYVGKEKNNNKIIKNMVNRIIHRGPDEQNVYEDECVSLGFARLSIIDLNNGTQPMLNEDNSMVLVFNGEIYNFKVIREDLIEKGHKFRTNTDSEVILHGYEEYGSEILKKLRGMFAFTIWDKKKNILFGARDIFGIKPYYYYKNNNSFMFGSEIKSFLEHPKFIKKLRKEKLVEYLTFTAIPGSETFFENVYKLLPSHYYIYDLTTGEMKIDKYYEIKYDIDNDKTMEEYAELISASVKESVEAHKISDVEVGCFLSSGVDSSYVVNELAKNNDIKTYTVGFENKKYSEIDAVKEFAEEINVKNKCKYISADEYFDSVHKVQYHMDEPLANPSANLLYFVSNLAAQEVKVVMSGEGADEMFGGYNVYKEPLDIANYQKIPYFIRKLIALLVTPLPDFRGRSFLIRGSKPIEKRYIGNSNIFSDRDKLKILKDDYKMVDPYEIVRPLYDNVKDMDDVTKMQYVDIHMWMLHEILQKADKMSMANSLELRVPLLDKEIFELARTIPTRFKVSKENTKLAFRMAANKDINNTTSSRKKMAFPLPMPEWLREDKYYNIIKESFTSDVAREFFNTDELVRILDVHKSGKHNNSRKIWTVYTFLVWYEEYFVKN